LLAPALTNLGCNKTLRVELLGTGNNVSLSRREADVAIRIEDDVFSIDSLPDLIVTQQLPDLEFAVYCNKNHDPEKLPWAGLVEEGRRTKGMETMNCLAADTGIRFRALPH